MYFYALVVALTVSAVCCQRHNGGGVSFRKFDRKAPDEFTGGECSKSTMCPTGSSCAKGQCADCTCEPLRCLQSVEICTALNCASDEECYIKHEANYAARTATARPVCAKKNPCATVNCQSGEQCRVFFCGEEPPVGRCISSTADPCTNVHCPTNYNCRANSAHCFGAPCKFDAACADVSACQSCTFQQYCQMQEQHDATFTGHLFKGVCAAYEGGLPFPGTGSNPGQGVRPGGRGSGGRGGGRRF